MKEIGGYFELELSKNIEYHHELLKLNSARNAFKYILKVRKPDRVFIPTYICDSVIEPLEELNIHYEFYNVDKKFEIVQNITLKDCEMILYVNYFALKSEYIQSLVDRYDNKLVVDNTQAFFEKPTKNIDTIYSPRKFFGVSDGGYLSSNIFLDENLIQDKSYDSSIQLLGRIDKSASSFYDDYQKAETRLINQPIKYMSKLTQSILSSIDYKNIVNKRRENFKFLHKRLKDINLISIDDSFKSVPFVYPLMIDSKDLREKLINNKIYIAKYWSEVLERQKVTVTEKNFVNQIIPLPCDQRYDLDDMKIIIKVIINNICKIHQNDNYTDLLEYFNIIDNSYSKVLGVNNSLSEYCDKLSKNAKVYYLVLSNDKIGLLAFYANNYKEKIAFISSISLISYYQGYGLGVKLLNFLEEYLRKIEFNEIRLEVSKNNLNAIKFYKQYGFSVFEKKQISLIMSKILKG